MRVVGLIGGMSWESTVHYYRYLNEAIKERLGGFHSAKVVLYSVDFSEVEVLQAAEDWQGAGTLLAKAARAVEVAGADCVVLCTNTMHKVAAAIEAAIRIPLLHIADATGQEIVKSGVSTVGLLGTRFTMEEPFYKDRLLDRYDVEVVIPEAVDRDLVHRVIFDELVMGTFSDESRAEFRRILTELAQRGAEGVVLGCTEIPLLVRPEDSPLPLFDTTAIHARKAAQWALQDESPRP